MLQNSALCPYLKIVLQSLIYLAPQQLLCVLRAVKLDGTELSRKYRPRNANCTVYPIILGDVRIVCRTRTIRERKVWHRSKARVLQVASFFCAHHHPHWMHTWQQRAGLPLRYALSCKFANIRHCTRRGVGRGKAPAVKAY